MGERIKGLFTDLDRLVLILIADSIASLLEYIGFKGSLVYLGYKGSNSQWLHGSAWLGFVEAVLFLANIIGQAQEDKSSSRVGFWVAKVSDLVLGAYFIVMVSYQISTLHEATSSIQGIDIVVVGFFVGVIQAGCIWICPTGSDNGRSAKMKLVIAALTNIVMSLVVGGGVWLGLWWLDRVASVFLPFFSVGYVAVTLLHRKKVIQQAENEDPGDVLGI